MGLWTLTYYGLIQQAKLIEDPNNLDYNLTNLIKRHRIMFFGLVESGSISHYICLFYSLRNKETVMTMSMCRVPKKLQHHMRKETTAAKTEEDEDEEEEEVGEDGTISVEVSVPFSWESQPGTPRVRLCQSPHLPPPPPPLTPPPSYYYNLINSNTPIKTQSKPNLLTSIFQRHSAALRRTSCSSYLSWSSSSSSSSSSSYSHSQSCPKSYSVPSSPMTKPNFWRYPSTPRQSYHKDVEVEAEEEQEVEEEEDEFESPVSTLCFGSRATTAKSRGCWYSSFV